MPNFIKDSSFMKKFFASRSESEQNDFIQSLVSGENETPEAGAVSPEVVAEQTQETHMDEKALDALKAELKASQEANDKIMAEFADFKKQSAVSAEEAIKGESEDFASDLIMSGHFAPSAKDGLKAFYAKLKDIEICTGDDAKIEGKTLTQCFADFFAKDGPVAAAQQLASGSVALGGSLQDSGLFVTGHVLKTEDDGLMTEEQISGHASDVAGKGKRRSRAK